MSYIIRMPKLGLEMQQGTLLEWAIEEGETVEEGELIAEIESEKSIGEVEARADGILRRTYLEEGETVPPSTPIGILAPEDADVSDLEQEVESDLEVDAEADETPEPAESTATATEPDAGSADTSDVKATPRAKQRADELGVDLATIEGTGVQGAVTAEDVEEAQAAGGDGVEERELSGMRRTIADRLGQSYREAVHVTEHRTADAAALRAAATAASDQLEGDVSVTDVLLRALSATLIEHPEFNATYEDGVHRIYDAQHVCIAVDVEEGLVTPAMRDVESLSIDELADERRRVTDLALEGEYTMDDLQGGTFTVTNLGVLGVESFDPVINPPQIAILGVDSLEERVVPGDDGEPAVRPVLPLDLSFDHRIVDGADAARFLATLVEYVEEPWDLFEGVTPTEAAAVTRPDRSVTASAGPEFTGTVSAGSFEYEFAPEAQFGGGDAPTPVDHFLGAFAACLSGSIAIQADIRDVDLESVDVEMTGEPAEGSLESVTVDVEIAADADDDVLGRIVENGERTCHVSELLREDLPVDLDWTRA
ncbi:2-oxo acid dehydrogenase subunit E2 [Natribaculum luteum]|uniref:2-oxo acid dehydrogenase subunit E2 n=1 Tax=Natribaculum luteum TaxID=1586232 RepID=A0ABD5P4M6_9EURY